MLLILSQVVGENVTFSSNMVTSVEDNDVNLTTSNSLEIESNWFDHDFILCVILTTIFRFAN